MKLYWKLILIIAACLLAGLIILGIVRNCRQPDPVLIEIPVFPTIEPIPTLIPLIPIPTEVIVDIEDRIIENSTEQLTAAELKDRIEQELERRGLKP